MLIVPENAVPPVPTLTENAAVPLLNVTDGEVPNPLQIVGAVADIIRLPFNDCDVAALIVLAEIVPPVIAAFVVSPIIA